MSDDTSTWWGLRWTQSYGQPDTKAKTTTTTEAEGEAEEQPKP